MQQILEKNPIYKGNVKKQIVELHEKMKQENMK